MSEPFQPTLDFEAADHANEVGEALVVDLDGFEGPLDLLLTLARQQKVDLLRLSISALADQYLSFVAAARQKDFALTADYLVMASWLTFLKSKLLLPKPDTPKDPERAGAEELAEGLAFRLIKLDAMRRAVESLKALPQIGRDKFLRSDPEVIHVQAATPRFDVDLYGLITAYVQQQTRESRRDYRPGRRGEAYPLASARDRLRALTPGLTQWTSLTGLAPFGQTDGPSRASYVASTFSAGLELVKEGEIEARQLDAFAEVFIRARQDPPPSEPGS